MDSQILGLIGFFALLGFGFWLMFGKPGNKKPSNQDPDGSSGVDRGGSGGPDSNRLHCKHVRRA
jgi:hypothetical protein